MKFIIFYKLHITDAMKDTVDFNTLSQSVPNSIMLYCYDNPVAHYITCVVSKRKYNFCESRDKQQVLHMITTIYHAQQLWSITIIDLL